MTPLTKRSRAVVIGAGLGGLALALRLQGQGFEVTVLEQQPAPGGRAARLRDGGFTWDTGPSLITMPWVLEEAFAADRVFYLGDVIKNLAMAFVATSVHRAFPDLLASRTTKRGIDLP